MSRNHRNHRCNDSAGLLETLGMLFETLLIGPLRVVLVILIVVIGSIYFMYAKGHDTVPGSKTEAYEIVNFGRKMVNSTGNSVYMVGMDIKNKTGSYIYGVKLHSVLYECKEEEILKLQGPDLSTCDAIDDSDDEVNVKAEDGMQGRIDTFIGFKNTPYKKINDYWVDVQVSQILIDKDHQAF